MQGFVIRLNRWFRELDRRNQLLLLIFVALIAAFCCDWNGEYVPKTVSLSAIATVAYLIGRNVNAPPDAEELRGRREWKRAHTVARELEGISVLLRQQLNQHQNAIAKFKDRVDRMSGSMEAGAWQELCLEAEEALRPTLQLGSHVAQAYDQIRQQTNHLMSFSDARTDPLTRVLNRRGLDETLESLFALLTRYDQPFSIAMFDLDEFKQVNDLRGHVFGDQVLQGTARVIDENVRETDFVARYGGEEFVVVMPQTDLAGACIFGERVRQAVEAKGTTTVSGGVATAADGDDPQTLLSRADAAMYAAKSAGRNRVFRSTGSEIESLTSVPAQSTTSSQGQDSQRPNIAVEA